MEELRQAKSKIMNDEVFISESFQRRLKTFEKTTLTQFAELGDECEVKTEWYKLQKKSHISIVGKDYLFAGGGCHLVLYDTMGKKEYFHKANSTVHGDGVDSYTGHHYQNIIAFAEQRFCPRIFILKCPTFEEVAVLSDGAPEGYKSMTFASSEYIFALSYQPYYNLHLWNWRTKEKIHVEATNLIGNKQYIKSNMISQILVAQLTFRSAAKIQIWEIQPYFRKSLFTKHKINLKHTEVTRITHSVWSNDSCLYILNENGSVYQISGTPLLATKIITSEVVAGDFDPIFCWYKDGIIVMNKLHELHHYSRSKNWEKNFTLVPRPFDQLVNLRERLWGWHQGKLYQIDIEKCTFTLIHNLSSDTVDYEFIYPRGDTMISYSDHNEIQCWDVKTGKSLCSLQWEDEICSMDSNPRYPYVAVGLKTGLLQFVSAVIPTDLKIFTEFHLTSTPITKIRFNREGNVIVAAHLLFGTFFVLEGVPGEKINILSYINYRRTTIDFCIVEQMTQYLIYLLVRRGNNYYCSKKIVCKIVSKLDGTVKKKLYEAKEPKTSSELSEQILQVEQSQESYYSQSAENFSAICAYNNLLYTIPYQSRNIRVCSLEHRRINTHMEQPSGHFLRKINMHVGDYHVITWGADGLVTIRTIDLKEILATFSPHHRYGMGTMKAVCSPTLKYIVSMGKHGDLCCTNLVNLKESPELLRELNNNYPNLEQRFSAKTIGFIPIDNEEEEIDGFKCKNYVEYLNHKAYVEEERAANAIKKRLMADFDVLKFEVVQLLEANLNGPESEKVDILEFYLYQRMRKHKEAMTNFECEWIRRWSKQMIEAQDKVSNWIKTTFWEPMMLKKTLLFGIFSNFAVENYVILPPKKGDQNQLDALMFRRRAESVLSTMDTLPVWIAASKSFLMEHLSKKPSLQIKDNQLELIQLLGTDEDELLKEEEHDKYLRVIRKTYFGGSTSYQFIEPHPDTYTQCEITSFYQAKMQMRLLQENEQKLRIAFNKSFDELRSVKMREMSTIKEKNERLRYIVSELNLPNVFIEDPVWEPSEKPERLTEVDDSEMSITPYISPSQQALLDAQAAEAEKIRLALLADDFREKALMEMMWGVLEIRWEDVIKQDIPKPKCMLEKDPVDYTEEDIKAVSDYEKRVTFLMSERARYKNMLEHEYKKVSDNVKETVKKFDSRLRDLLLLKLKMESSRLMEELNIQRLQAWCQERIENKEKEEEILHWIKYVENRIVQIHKNMIKVQESMNECKGVAEMLANKDKQLEKQFKKEISDNSNLIQAQSMKLYKKNPRTGLKNVNSSSLLCELARCVVSKERTIILTHDCLDYLRSVDTLDQYVGVPNTIDEYLYKIICRHRRFRLENDLRVKGNSADQQDIENTLAFLQKRLAQKKDFVNNLAKNLEKAREDTLKHLLNKQVVKVYPQGLVEIPLTGRESDFKDAAIVRRKDVEEINEIITKTGERKLKVMFEKMIHRRSILLKEWQHRHMSMEIEDLQTKMDVVNNIKVSKEIQDFLKKKAKGIPTDKGVMTLDQEIEVIRKSYERSILGRKLKVEELEAQIKDYAKKNKILDQKIAEINVDVCEQHLNRDLDFEKKQAQSIKHRMAAIVKRSNLVKEIQDQHNEILVLQTELELLRLKTYPTLKFKTLS